MSTSASSHHKCKQFVERLRMRTKGTCGKYPCVIPFDLATAHRMNVHSDNCYICMGKIAGYNKKNKCKAENLSFLSDILPVTYTGEIPVSVFKELISLEIQECGSDED